MNLVRVHVKQNVIMGPFNLSIHFSWCKQCMCIFESCVNMKSGKNLKRQSNSHLLLFKDKLYSTSIQQINLAFSSCSNVFLSPFACGFCITCSVLNMLFSLDNNVTLANIIPSTYVLSGPIVTFIAIPFICSDHLFHHSSFFCQNYLDQIWFTVAIKHNGNFHKTEIIWKYISHIQWQCIINKK